MKIFSINKIASFIDSTEVLAFHADMFHGLADRNGKEYPHDPVVWAYTKSPNILQISRTFRNIPAVCCPSSNLVVNGQLAGRLRGVPSIRLQPVEFKRLVDIPYEKGDNWWEDGWTDPDPCNYLRTMPDVAEFHKQIGNYYELQTWRVQDLVEKFEPCKDFEIETSTPPGSEIAVVRLCDRMMQEYPILWAEGCILISDGVFHIFDNSLDRDFFYIREYDL